MAILTNELVVAALALAIAFRIVFLAWDKRR